MKSPIGVDWNMYYSVVNSACGLTGPQAINRAMAAMIQHHGNEDDDWELTETRTVTETRTIRLRRARGYATTRQRVSRFAVPTGLASLAVWLGKDLWLDAWAYFKSLFS